MSKLLRVSNPNRGKKLIASTGEFDQFQEKVRSKFVLADDDQIEFFDDQGAEIDGEVFPILIDQPIIPNIVFHVQGEDSAQISIPPGNCSSVASQIIYVTGTPTLSPQVSSSGPLSEKDIDIYKQILESHVDQSQQLSDIIKDCNNKSFVDATSAVILTKEFVGKLVELKRESPSTRDQKLFARAIVSLVPSWRYPGTLDGIDVLYDEVNRTGLIQSKLRDLHKNLKKKSPIYSCIHT